MSDELISPELALVCPDLRARAIAALPAQPWLPMQPQPIEESLRRAHAAPADRAAATTRDDATVAGTVVTYILGRAADLLAITASITLFVLILAAVAGIVRG